jgi:c-di-GMP-binding flagellar brake protein YcgR
MNLTKINSKEKIREIIKNAHREEEISLVWKLAQSGRVSEDVKIHTYKDKANEIVFKAVSERNTLSEVLSGSEFINIYIVNKGIVFQSELVRVGEDFEFAIKYPEEIYLHDRRGDVRVHVEEADQCKMSFKVYDDKSGKFRSFKKDVFDISLGGVSFLVNRDEARLIEIGDSLDFMIVAYKDKDLMVESKVVNKSKLSKKTNPELIYDAYKIGVQFNDIPGDDKKNLFVFILNKAKDLLK